CILGIFLYVMPFAMVYCPQLLVLGSAPPVVLEMILSYAFLTIALAAAVQGWLFRNLDTVSRVLCFAACLLLGMPEVSADIAGLLLLAGVAAFNYARRKTSPLDA
ncbi:MAG: hypothetical protein FWG35_06685, partial [Spirochaetaceae bacterium]|nr:hypothetical protein [Spirochaetaceae bacterium]